MFRCGVVTVFHTVDEGAERVEEPPLAGSPALDLSTTPAHLRPYLHKPSSLLSCAPSFSLLITPFNEYSSNRISASSHGTNHEEAVPRRTASTKFGTISLARYFKVGEMLWRKFERRCDIEGSENFVRRVLCNSLDS